MTGIIYEYVIKDLTPTEFSIPEGGVILSAQMRGGFLSMWVFADPKAPEVKRSFQIVGIGLGSPVTRDFQLTNSGFQFDDGEYIYITTVQIQALNLVYHLFEITKK